MGKVYIVRLVFALALSAFMISCGGGSSSDSQEVSELESATPVENLSLVKTFDGEFNWVSTLAGNFTVSWQDPKYGSYVDGIGTEAWFDSPGGIAIKGTDLYVADIQNHVIRKVIINPDSDEYGKVTTFAGTPNKAGTTDGIGSSAMFSNPTGLATDGHYLYVVSGENQTIRKIFIGDPDSDDYANVTTLAGSPGETGSTNGIGSLARFSDPMEIATDGEYLYVTEYGTYAIRQIYIGDPESDDYAMVTTFAGSRDESGSTDDIGSLARFYDPRGLATDGTNLFVADRLNHTIRQIDIATGAVSTLAGNTGENGYDDGNGSNALFNHPHLLTTDGTNLYVSGESMDSIRKIEIDTGEVTTVAGMKNNWGYYSEGSDDGHSSVATFERPMGLATDGTNLFLADKKNHLIRKISRRYEPSGLANDGKNLFFSDPLNHTVHHFDPETGEDALLAGAFGESGQEDATGADATFNGPTALATDGEFLYVADTGNNAIRRITISDGTVETVPGTFNAPEGLALHGNSLYVADTGDGAIQRIDLATQDVTILADGFHQPTGIATDGDFIYVANTGDHTIRKVEISTGLVTTLAGEEDVFGSGEKDLENGLEANFDSPKGLSLHDGFLYVADNGNHTIRKIDLSSGETSTPVGLAGQAGFEVGPLPATLNGPLCLTVADGVLYLTVPEEASIMSTPAP